MKKILNIILVVAFILCAKATALAANDIGVIDITMVWDKYEKSVKIDKTADEKDVELEKFLLEKKRLIAQGSTPVERKNLEDKYVKEFQVKVEETKKWYATEQQKLEATMMTTIKKIAADKSLSVVLNKKTTIYGGVDITNEVITTLNQQ
jgi:Skp family chaperone for outer membrane proteins